MVFQEIITENHLSDSANLKNQSGSYLFLCYCVTFLVQIVEQTAKSITFLHLIFGHIKIQNLLFIKQGFWFLFYVFF